MSNCSRIVSLLATALGSTLCLPVFAAAPRYTVDKIWTTDEGLPQNSVIALTQTHDGYLWLGTRNGLVRFDGIGRFSGGGKIQFPVFNDNNTPELNSSTIVKLFEDSRGDLWLGTENAGVVLANKDGKLSGVDIGRGTRQGRLMAACEDQAGAVWLYTADGRLCRYRDKQVDVWEVGAERPSNCRALVVDDAGLLWIGTDWGLWALDPRSAATGAGLVVAHELPVGKLDFLVPSSRGGFWMLADGKITKYKNRQVQQQLGSYAWAAGLPIFAACEDRDGNLVVATYGDGVYWLDDQGKGTRIQGLSHSYILSLTIDSEGCLWVGTDGGGLNRVKRQKFDVLTGSEGFIVQSVCEDNAAGLWVGYNWERIDYWKDGALQQQFTNLLSYSVAFPERWYIRSLYVDRSQRVWAGTWSAGGARLVSLFELKNGSFQAVTGASSVNQDVSAIYQDHKGALWVGTEGGLSRWDGTNWKRYTIRDGLSSDLVRALAETGDDLWIGTQRGGLSRLRDGKFTVYRKQPAGLPSDDIASLYADADGVLWIGTSGGLARFKDGNWTHYSQQHGLISDNIGFLVEDGEGHLWLGSNAGLMRVPKSELNAFAAGTTNFLYCRTFGRADGLPSGECTFGSQPGACVGRDGTLWFPTIKGLASLNPAQLYPNTNPPPVIIEAVLIDGERKNRDTLRAGAPYALTVPARSERLEIDYTSLNLAAPERARFQYRMEGHEKDWTDARNERAAHYHKLPPGSYHFQVTACNEDGVWSKTPVSLPIRVLPPFWKTAWFISLATLFALANIAGLVHYISTQKLQRQLATLREQEALEKERARIARDLHDQLGANLTQVALLGEMAEADKETPVEVEAHAKQISATARETTRALDEIVWTVNPSNDTLDGLINYVCKYAQEYFALAGLRYRLDVPSNLPATPISPEVRHNVFLATKEAVNNVVKHAHASAAWLKLQLRPDQFSLQLEDNGRGISSTDQEKARNGLKNMRKRMEDIGGAFSLSPRAEGGTIVELTVPLKPNSAPAS
jgi:ligand-binding sensor domain-containing protein/signal transduction histidine kinase